MPSDNQPVLDPRTQWFLQFLIDLKRPQVFEVPVEEARAMHVKGQQMFAPPQQPAHIEDRTIAGPAGNLALRIVRPPNSTGPLPMLMYFHGGGWVLGDMNTYDRFIRQLANEAGVALVFPEYTRAPEARYPVAIEQCYAATKWVAEHAQELNVDSTRLAVAGDSAGGNIAAVVSLMAKERGGPRIAAQVLIYPATEAGFNTPSYHQFGQGYYLTGEASHWFWEQYAPDRAADQDPHACPLLVSLEQMKGLPPALIITAECDILRDEGEAYGRKLLEAGVPVTCTRYLGAIHGFMGANALAETPAARAATSQVVTMLREALAAKPAEMAAD